MANASKTKTTQVCELMPMESMTSDTVNSFLSISIPFDSRPNRPRRTAEPEARLAARSSSEIPSFAQQQDRRGAFRETAGTSAISRRCRQCLRSSRAPPRDPHDLSKSGGLRKKRLRASLLSDSLGNDNGRSDKADAYERTQRLRGKPRLFKTYEIREDRSSSRGYALSHVHRLQGSIPALPAESLSESKGQGWGRGGAARTGSPDAWPGA